MKKIIIVLLVFYSNIAFSQFNIPFQNPKTPEQYSFEKYGNVPVSNYTGRPNITIPLYTIKYGDIEIPLDIAYTSNGIRVDEEASQFGLGWYFSTGMISQTINDKDDLKYQHVFKKPQYLWASSIGYPITPNPDWFVDNNQNWSIVNSPLRVNRSASAPSLDKYFITRLRSEGAFGNSTYYDTNMSDYGLIIGNSNSNIDLSEDTFQANFFGHSLLFSIDGNSFKILNGTGYKIEKLSVSDTTLLDKYKWIITAPDGISYYFEQEKRTYNMPGDSSHSSPNYESEGTGYRTYAENINPDLNYFVNAASNSRIWKITKIRDTKGNEVLFNYYELQPIYSYSGGSGKCDFLNIETISNEPRNAGLWSGTGTSLNYDGPNFTPSDTTPPFSAVGTYIRTDAFSGGILYQEKSILKEIVFGNSKVELINSDRLDIPQDKKVDFINVRYNDGIIKTISFSYDYFNSNNSENTQKRLKLNAVNLGEKPYIFTYNSIELPNKDSDSTDYWGFYNGMPNTSSINNPFRLYRDSSTIPSWAKYFLPLIEGKANKSAHPEFCKAGILKKVIYPTGGSTELVYELNEFDNYFFPNYNNKVGLTSENNYQRDYVQTTSKGFGLRISQTIDRDSNEQILHKKVYTYFGGKHIPAYLAYNDIDRYKSVTYTLQSVPSGQDIPYYYRRTIQGSKITSYNSSIFQSSVLGNGNFVGYDKVEVRDEDTSGENIGKISSSYSNVPDVNARTKFGIAGGIVGAGVGLPAYFCDYFGESIRNADLDNGLITKEEVYNRGHNLIQKTEYDYNINTYSLNAIYNVKSYTLPGRYGYILNSGQEVVFLEHLLFYYPLKSFKCLLSTKKTTEYFPSNAKWNLTTYDYNSNNLLVRNDTRDQFGNYFKRESTMYDPSVAQLQKNILNLPLTVNTEENGVAKEKQDYIYEDTDFSKVIRVENHTRGNSATEFTRIMYYDRYDDKGNILQYHQQNGIYTCIVWGYNQTLPLAKIENVRYSDIESYISNIQGTSNQNDTSSLLNQLTDFRNTISAQYPNAMITTYTHIPLVGIKTVTDPKGYTHTYKYDSLNRFENVKDDDGNIFSEKEYHFRP